MRSTRSKANSGRYAVIMTMVEKRIGRPTSLARCAMLFSSRYCLGLSSRFLRIVSSITIAPSTIIPKSIAPSDRRLAGISVRCIRIKAISNDTGIVIDTNNAPRQLPRNRISTRNTKAIPISKVWDTVLKVVSTKLVRSKKVCILTPSGNVSLFNSSTAT